jgi:hypothetical protein
MQICMRTKRIFDKTLLITGCSGSLIVQVLPEYFHFHSTARVFLSDVISFTILPLGPLLCLPR